MSAYSKRSDPFKWSDLLRQEYLAATATSWLFHNQNTSSQRMVSLENNKLNSSFSTDRLYTTDRLENEIRRSNFDRIYQPFLQRQSLLNKSHSHSHMQQYQRKYPLSLSKKEYKVSSSHNLYKNNHYDSKISCIDELGDPCFVDYRHQFGKKGCGMLKKKARKQNYLYKQPSVQIIREIHHHHYAPVPPQPIIGPARVIGPPILTQTTIPIATKVTPAHFYHHNSPVVNQLSRSLVISPGNPNMITSQIFKPDQTQTFNSFSQIVQNVTKQTHRLGKSQGKKGLQLTIKQEFNTPTFKCIPKN